jgi:hypothetical protein
LSAHSITQIEPAAGVLVDERERRARGRTAAERRDQAGHERGLARAEIADERDRIAAPDDLRESRSGTLGGAGVAQRDRHASSDRSLSSQ